MSTFITMNNCLVWKGPESFHKVLFQKGLGNTVPDRLVLRSVCIVSLDSKNIIMSSFRHLRELWPRVSQTAAVHAIANCLLKLRAFSKAVCDMSCGVCHLTGNHNSNGQARCSKVVLWICGLLVLPWVAQTGKKTGFCQPQ